MAAAPRDQDALDLLAQRSFEGAALTGFDLETQARRLTVRFYGNLRRDDRTFLATVTFFGASAFGVENESGAFPESVLLSGFDVSYSDPDDQGAAELHGRSSWQLFWSFDGVAYEEVAATLSSYRDDL